MEPRPWRLLLISDDETDQALLRELLATLTEPPVLDCVPDHDSGAATLAGNPYDACLIAERLEPHDTLDKVRACAARGYRSALILWLRFPDRDLGRAALTAGALDYLTREQIDTALLERSLRTAIARKRAEVGLLQTSAELLACRRELEQRLFQTTVLGEMVSLLQTCQNADEAFAIVTCSAAKLFPTETGGLYVFGESAGQLHAAAVWGEDCSAVGEFAREDCWALRRGRMHLVPDAATGLLCGHVGQPLPASCLCVPMMASGEAVGVLHLQANDRVAPSQRERDHLPEAKQRLAQIVAEQLALALANLKLRETLRGGHEQLCTTESRVIK